MSHPAEQDLALYATGDLSWFSRLGIARHVRACADCAEAVEDFREVSSLLSTSNPEIEDWDTLAAEMKANIRVGLEAGACLPTTAVPNRVVGNEQPFDLSPRTSGSWNAPVVKEAASSVAFFSPRYALALASLMILIGAGIVLRPNQPKPNPTILATQQQSIKVDTEGVTITNVYME